MWRFHENTDRTTEIDFIDRYVVDIDRRYDKVPRTPSRLAPPGFITRIVTGALCGLATGLSRNGMILGLVAGIIGALAGILGGAKARSLLAKTFGRDLPAALFEDAIAIGFAAFGLFRSVHHSS